MTTPQEINHQAKTIYQYMQLHQDVKSADAIIVCCSNDLRVADYAVVLFQQNYAPMIIFSGGKAHADDVLATGWDDAEAVMFAKRAITLGVPEDAILIEDQAQHSGDNVVLTRVLLEKKGISIRSAIVLQKPYAERRAFATFRKQWPELDIVVTSPKIAFEQYWSDQLPFKTVLQIMLGDFIRIKTYAEQGFQIPQEIPDMVWEAYEKLVAAGYSGER